MGDLEPEYHLHQLQTISTTSDTKVNLTGINGCLFEIIGKKASHFHEI